MDGMSEETFDLERAERLLPRLEQLLRAALSVKKQVTSSGQEQARMLERIVMAGGSQVDPEVFMRSKRRKEAAGARLREAVEEIESLGCYLKDLDIGLVDFPARLGDRELLLCWKLGETRIQFWHGMDEGFAGRKPLDDQMIRQMQRSSAH